MPQQLQAQMDDVQNLQGIQQQEFIVEGLGRTATPTGLLSLKFDIPTDGQRIDFLRVGGNPSLSLDVRSANAVSKGTGLIWLVLCVIGILLLLGPGRRGEAIVFCQRLFLILAVAGLAAWLFTIGDLKSIGLIACIGGAIAFAVTTAVSHLRATKSQNATPV